MFTDKELVEVMPKLRKFAYKLTKSSVDGEDLLQTVLLKAIENKYKFDQGSNLWGWCSKIMFNQFVSEYRRRNKRGTQFDPEPIINAQFVKANAEELTDLSLIGDKLDKMSTEHKNIIMLVGMLGYTYAEAASQLGIPLGTVRSRYFRARKIIQGLAC